MEYCSLQPERLTEFSPGQDDPEKLGERRPWLNDHATLPSAVECWQMEIPAFGRNGKMSEP
jgi:hypothetical protein